MDNSVPLAPSPPTASPARGIGRISMALLRALGIAGVAGLFGAGAGYYAALSVPLPPAVVVMDVDRAMAAAAREASKSGNSKAAADQAVAVLRARARAYVDSGYVVIDKAAVIDMPAELLIDPAPSPPPAGASR